ncbi:uncharacterized [Tachysurus ichikawai]
MSIYGLRDTPLVPFLGAALISIYSLKGTPILETSIRLPAICSAADRRGVSWEQGNKGVSRSSVRVGDFTAAWDERMWHVDEVVCPLAQ